MPFNTSILDRTLTYRQEKREQERQKILAQVVHCLDTIGPQYDIQQAYLFGSLTRPGDFRETSDVDLAIVGNLPEDVFALISMLAAELGREVDLIALEKCHFAHRIRERGILWTKTP